MCNIATNGLKIYTNICITVTNVQHNTAVAARWCSYAVLGERSQTAPQILPPEPAVQYTEIKATVYHLYISVLLKQSHICTDCMDSFMLCTSLMTFV